MTGLKFTEMANLLQQIGYKAEESAQALHTVYSGVTPLEMGQSLKKYWPEAALNATQMAQILGKLYGIIPPPIEKSHEQDGKIQELTTNERAKQLKKDNAKPK